MLASLEEAVNRRQWGQQEELLASLWDITHALYVAFLSANTAAKDRGRLPKPMRYPRPQLVEKRQKRSWAEVLGSMVRR